MDNNLKSKGGGAFLPTLINRFRWGILRQSFMKKALFLILALCLVMSVSINAFAAEIGESGGAGSTPVTLTTTNDGLYGEPNPTPTKLNVTVPTTFPMAMSDDGKVVTATDCKIVNLSYGAVRVRSVSISAASGWHLTAFGDKSTLAGEKVDSNKLGFALSIGNGAQVQTSTSEETQTLISSPITGCYMTGVGDPKNNIAPISYSAIVTPLSGTLNTATIANVVFVVEWDTAE